MLVAHFYKCIIYFNSKQGLRFTSFLFFTMYSEVLSVMALAGLATAGFSAPGPMKRQAAGGQSVPTAQFKSRFEESRIVPDVIAALDPSVSFYAAYNTISGRPALLVPGSTLTISGKRMARNRGPPLADGF